MKKLKSKYISSKEIYILLTLTKSIVNKGILTLMYSSALDGATIRYLKVKHLLDACDEYFRYGEEKTVSNLLYKNPNDIIPCWREESSSGVKLTFSSPESLFYIFLHLRERLDKSNIDSDDYLFTNTKGKQISQNNITDIFKKSEEIRVFSKNKYLSTKFKAKDLKKNFIIVAEHSLPESMDAKKSFIGLCTRSVPKDNVWYNTSLSGYDILRKYYLDMLPYLTAKNYETQLKLSTELELSYEKEKYPDNKLKELIKYYINNKFSDYISNYYHFKEINEIKDIYESDEFKQSEEYSDFEKHTNTDEFKDFFKCINSEEFKKFEKNGEDEFKRFNMNLDNFRELCAIYNNNYLFKFENSFLDEVWVEADIQTFFDGCDMPTLRITKDNINQKIPIFLGIMNKLKFFERYDFEEIMYKNNTNFNMKSQIVYELKRMILIDLKGKQFINVGLSNIVDMLQSIGLIFK